MKNVRVHILSSFEWNEIKEKTNTHQNAYFHITAVCIALKHTNAKSSLYLFFAGASAMYEYLYKCTTQRRHPSAMPMPPLYDDHHHK